MSIRSVARNFLIPLGIVFSIASPAFAQNTTDLNFEYFMNEVQPIFLAKRDGINVASSVGKEGDKSTGPRAISIYNNIIIIKFSSRYIIGWR